jgi:hypothetical protein
MSTTSQSTPTPTPGPRATRGEAGPPLVGLAAISTGLFVTGVVVTSVMAGAVWPSPFEDSETVLAYFRDHGDAVTVGTFFQFGSAIPLAIYAATASTRLRNLGIRNPGATIALVGGVLSAVFVALSALISWTMVRPEVATDPAVLTALSNLSFMTGGPAAIVPFGLLLAGIATPGLLGRLLPRGFAITGMILALMAELSALTLLLDGAAYLLPVARFGGLAWLIAAGVMLPKRRKPANA